MGQFTAEVVDKLRERLFTLQQTAASRADRDALNQVWCCTNALSNAYSLQKHQVDVFMVVIVQEAKAIGDEFLQLEKYVNMNYMAFHKVGWH